MLIHAIMVSYKRSETAANTLTHFLEQSRPPNSVTIVDNSPECGLAQRLEAVLASVPSTFIVAEGNVGPAGGIALGMEHVLTYAEDEDWILTIDDDDPPPDAETLERLLSLAIEATSADPMAAAVGNVGQNFDLSRGRVTQIRDSELRQGPSQVDHIGGNQCPMYRVRAVRAIGVFDHRLFFGFEELEYGLRLRSSGWNLYCDGAWRLKRRAQHRADGKSNSSVRQARTSTGRALPATSWRYYYSKRNLAVILLRHGRHVAAIRVLAEGLLSSMRLCVFGSVRDGATRARLTIQAGRDAFRGRMGRTVEPSSGVSHFLSPGPG